METVLVVGFNVRPMARSAKKAGYRVLAVDFWGDLDLSEWADKHTAILHQQPNERPDRPKGPTADSLVIGTQHLLEKHGPVDFILAGGGFDDQPKAWENLSKLGRLVGNPPDKLCRARDRKLTQKIANISGATIPQGYEACEANQFRWATNQLDLPIIVKPKFGSGGFQSRILRTEQDLDRYSAYHLFTADNPVLIQELIQGTDASVSLLCSGDAAIAVSINEQLIGLAELGKGRTKAYCGNIVPLKAPKIQIKKLVRISELMGTHLELLGSNGIDFVIDHQGTVHFMEINPRFQATIEALELVSNVNVVTYHIEACKGNLPAKRPVLHGYCTRLIVYAKSTCKIPNLSNFPGVVDIPIPGSVAERGDPMCTVNHIAESREKALAGAWDIANTIYQHLIPIPQHNID
ncbi:MAG: ATP-grasp domain-containing protein [Promethearchaeota archaeon]